MVSFLSLFKWYITVIQFQCQHFLVNRFFHTSSCGIINFHACSDYVIHFHVFSFGRLLIPFWGGN